MAATFLSAHLDDVPEFGASESGEMRWLPLRHYFGVRAFGTNAFAGDAGELLIGIHDELPGAGNAEPGHEEMYVVVRGAARFTLGDQTLEAQAGSVVFLPDPAVRRGAVATQDGTLVLAVGAAPGVAYAPSAWDLREVAAAGAPQHPDA